ncbi:FecR/PupR family sigma factor regulatory protein [Novosphingobium sp. Rr 2-17]|uniref:FecR family protein n=1 Tax=Novosphingobium sp. Rr 2-17 TaxID=555793 RepID=UPI0002698BF7|nr:FecR domain-containing protein [Novosphingobium sp. Rr 2-17]EIZ78133.1 FecR/PupR family sigma factor regulatory protein [Novosphingobium sp. Rr 2-17]
MSLDQEAADWFARMRGPEADNFREAFEAWYAVPAHALAYDRTARAWDTAMFLANTPTGKERNLGLAAARSPHAPPWVLVASIAFVLVLGSTLLVQFLSTSRHVATLTRLDAVALDQPPRHITFPDGSSAILDRGARLQVSFDAKLRRLRLLAGRGRFAVAHGDPRPFVVDAGAGSVTAHGTLFDVELTPNAVDVALLEGAVEVKNTASRTGGQTLELAAGHRVAVSGGAISAPALVEAAQRQWPTDMLTLTGVDLVDAITAFNRTSTKPVVIDQPPTRATKVTGVFKRSDPEGFARQVAVILGWKVEPREDGSLALLPQ